MILSAYIWALVTFVLSCIVSYTVGAPLPTNYVDIFFILVVYTSVFYVALKYTKQPD